MSEQQIIAQLNKNTKLLKTVIAQLNKNTASIKELQAAKTVIETPQPQVTVTEVKP